jgi:glycosyltransferase involved in cell wall biosynthesis
LKTAHFIQRYHPAIGGSEAWCRGVCRALVRQGIGVRVLTTTAYNEDEYWAEPPVEDCLVRLGPLDYDHGVWVRRYRPARFRRQAIARVAAGLERRRALYLYGPHAPGMLANLLRDMAGADLVHLHTAPYPHNLFAFLAARLGRRKIVFTPHFHPGHPHYEIAGNYWLMRRCQALFAVSEFEKRYLAAKGLDPRRIHVACNAVAPEDYAPRDLPAFREQVRRTHRMGCDTRCILFVGRKAPYKGADTLIAAVREMLPHQDLRLFLIGPSFAWFDRLYAGLSAAEREKIVDLGIVPHQEKVNYLHLCDVLALPSRHEAFGIVYLEAWICGKPVIAADTGAVPQLVRGCGLVSRYGDAADLRRKLEWILKERGAAEAMARRGRQMVLERYSWERTGRKVLSVYRTLARHAAPR